jgi:hypothetical protein
MDGYSLKYLSVFSHGHRYADADPYANLNGRISENNLRGLLHFKTLESLSLRIHDAAPSNLFELYAPLNSMHTLKELTLQYIFFDSIESKLFKERICTLQWLDELVHLEYLHLSQSRHLTLLEDITS